MIHQNSNKTVFIFFRLCNDEHTPFFTIYLLLFFIVFETQGGWHIFDLDMKVDLNINYQEKIMEDHE